MTNHAIDVFKVREFHLTSDICRHREFVSKYTKKLKSATIEGYVSTAQVTSVLEEFSFEELKLRSIQSIALSPLKLKAPLKVKFLKCEDLHWLPAEASWEMECEKLAISSFYIIANELKRILQIWFAGGLKNLKEFTMTGRCIKEAIFKVLEGFGIEEIDEDVFRTQRGDGTTATIVLKLFGLEMTIDE